jgi:hypothetical protein
MYWSCCTIFLPKLKEHDWKIRSTKVCAGNLKHELLNRLWSILAVNVLMWKNLTGKLSDIYKNCTVWGCGSFGKYVLCGWLALCFDWYTNLFRSGTGMHLGICCPRSGSVIFCLLKYVAKFCMTYFSYVTRKMKKLCMCSVCDAIPVQSHTLF